MDPLSTPKGSKLGLFSLHGQRFPRYGPILKIAIFRHETWKLKKVPKLRMDPFSTPADRNWAYFRSTGSGFLVTAILTFN